MRRSDAASFRRLLVQSMAAMREDRGISKLELANRMGIDHATVVRFEQSGNPQAGTIDRYLEAMGVGVDELLAKLLERRLLTK